MKLLQSIFRLSAVMFLIIICSGGANAQSGEDNRITRAGTFLDTGRPDRAAVILYDVLADSLETGERVRALYFLSESLQSLGRPLEQSQYLTEALSLDPEAEYADDVRVAYAQYVLDDGNHRNCIQLAGEFYENYPDSPLLPEMHSIEAEAWYREGEHLRAFNALSDIIAQFPDTDPAKEAVMKQGLCLYHLNLISGAIERLELYLAETPEGRNQPEAMYYLGLCYEISNRPNLAATAFRRVSLSHPSFDRVLNSFFRLGRAYFDTGQYAEAENAFLNYVSNTPASDPDHDEALFYLERIKFRTGEYTSELQIAEKFAEKYPDSPRSPGLLFDLARYYRASGDNEKAIAMYQRIISDFRYASYFDTAAGMIAETLDQAGDFERAKTFLLDAAHKAKNPSTAGKMYLRLGILTENRLDYNAAIAWYDSALAVNGAPQVSIDALTGIGRVFGLLKRWYQAAQTYERIIEEYPGWENIGDIYASLAEVYYAQGRIRDAAQIAEKGVNHLSGMRKTALKFRIADLYEEIDNRRALRMYRTMSTDESMPSDQRSRALLQYGNLSLSLGDSAAAHDAYSTVVAGSADSTDVRKAREALERFHPENQYFIE